MNKAKAGLIAIALLLFAGNAILRADSNSDGPVFEDKDTLLRPQNYRQWIFVGSSLGLSYAQNPSGAQAGGAQLYHNVYINPMAYREFAKTESFQTAR